MVYEWDGGVWVEGWFLRYGTWLMTADIFKNNLIQ